MERVRASTMAMHKSVELLKTAKVLFHELKDLGIALEVCGFSIMEKELPKGNQFLSIRGTLFPEPIPIQFDQEHQLEKVYKAWKDHQTFLVLDIMGEELRQHMTSMKQLVKDLNSVELLAGTAGKLASDDDPHGRLLVYHAFFSHGYLFLTNTQPIEEERILVRFAKVFEQTYTRFLDLKKAEERARQAQIEAALERIRSRAMAMQKSEELPEVALAFLTQVDHLSIPVLGVALSVVNTTEDTFVTYLADNTDDPGKRKLLQSAECKVGSFWLSNETVNRQRAGEKEFNLQASGEKLEAWIKFIEEVFSPERAQRMRSANLERIYAYAVEFYETSNFIFSSVKPLPDEDRSVIIRLVNTFRMSYLRFLDLKKAEEQAREAQIEAALERIRSRSLAMRDSAELSEVSTVLFRELFGFCDAIKSSGIVLCDRKTPEQWMCSFDIKMLPPIHIPRDFDQTIKNLYKAWEDQEELYIESLSKEEVREHSRRMMDLPEIKAIFERLPPSDVVEQAGQTNYAATFSQGYLLVITESPVEGLSMLPRFAKVFESIYTRFLDLKKAEAQAREAEIQLALERIRARTMAMHSSEELTEAASVLFQQILALDLKPVASAFIIVDEKNSTGEVFISADGTVIPDSFTLPYHGELAQDQILEAWKQRRPYIIVDLKGKNLKEHLRFIARNMPVGDMLEASGQAQPDRLALHIINFKYGFLGINYLEPNQEIIPLLQRFANVFEQTYTRFLDLKRAEAQAREFRIEASLEKVRAASMAMHQSEELPNVAQVLVEQLDNLQVKQLGSSIVEIDEESERYNQYSAHDNLKDNTKVLNIIRDFDLTPIFLGREILRRTRALERDFTIELTGSNLKEWMHYVRDNIHEARGVAMIQAGFESIYFHFAVFHRSSAVVITTPVPMPDDDRKILRRMANTFGVSYQRYLDLLRAEEQAREAQIEAALERVRARTMGMHKSDELKEVVAVLYKEIDVLGLSAFGFELVLVKPEDDILEYWSKPVSLEFAKCFKVPKKVHSFFERQWEAWEKQERRLVIELQGQAKIDFDTTFLTETDYRDLPEEVKRVITEPDSVTFSHAMMRHGFLEAIDKKPLTDEEFLILERFATVFEQTYTRFLDLQRAEAQAREAVRQASLDRVRGEIASMRTSEDLNYLTPLIWRELQSLEVPFIRCGVFIVNEEKNNVEVYLTTPEGQALAVLNLDLEANELTRDAVQHWKGSQMYTTRWERNDFMNWMQAMIKAGQVGDAETYQGSSSLPDTLHLHFVPFRQGMLYVGDIAPLPNEKLQLVKTLADAFSIAYARYEDFKNLEEAKTQIESTLHDLKSTQAQLVHSEKMASLGELTAGIAHEIQNPLNFVNNFSEVNRELLLELNEEIKKGNLEEVEMITKDLIENEEKIYFHGNRAGTIVRGMLEHSRNNKGQKELIDLNKLADEFLRLAYHGLRAQNRHFKAHWSTDLDPQLPLIKVVSQDIGRVILNLINNAFQAVAEKDALNKEHYSPEIRVKTQMLKDEVEISIEDNGPGIPEEIRNKIFQPFFTTKPTGQGTGLGLSLAYDIIKAHDGEIKLRTSPDTGTCFTVSLPIIN
ncbi:MAG: GHKL domain-containing protein [Saprospiraceae bacterium]|nr:GHKL domain-containing protein [Saprospiraceae bacterium]